MHRAVQLVGPAVMAHGTDERTAVGWRSTYAQDVAFLTLARVEGLRAGARVLDVGCGVGGLYKFFELTGLEVDYTGVDISPAMVASARQAHPGGRFEVRDILRNPPRGRYDYVFCSGALSLKMPRQEEYVQDMIATMFGLCDRALAFNLLSAHALVMRPGLQVAANDARYDWSDQVLQFAKSQSQLVTLVHDSDPGVFTVFVYRKNVTALDRLRELVQPGTTYDRAVREVIDYHVELGLWSELREYLDGIEPAPAVSYFRGQADAMLGNSDAAEAAFREAIVGDPTQVWPFVQIAYLYSRRGDLERAVAAGREAIAVAPRAEAPYEALAKIYFAHKRLPEALAVVAEMPAGPLAETLRSAVVDNLPDALAALDRALAHSPQYLPALVARADVLERMGNKDEAIAALRAAQRMSPLDRSISTRLDALFRATDQ